VRSILAGRLGLVTAVTGWREPAVVALLVAIGARQGSVQPREVAANLRVIKARRSKGPLVVALSALRRERICVNVVLPVAVDAQVARACETAIVDVAAIATLLIMSALKTKVANIVQSDDVRETLSCVARGAVGTKLSFVNLWLWVTCATTKAVGGPRLKGDAWMAISAAHGEVLAGQLVVTLGVVIEDVLASF
tara:strand:- start:22 stop:603 length:582 start_codon:yes stop_codon:yes gene_type:complete